MAYNEERKTIVWFSIIFKQNHGFCEGYNLAIKDVDAEIVVLLNSDVEVTSGWTIEPVKLLSENNQIVGCQPKILSYTNKDSFEHAGAGGGLIDKYGFPFCRGRIFDSIEVDKGQYDDTRKVFWASGACLFFKRNAFIELGGFDSRFFAHMEEIDLCWRAQNLGKEIYYCGKSTVYHLGGGTLAYNSPKKIYLNFRNNLLTLSKNLSPEIKSGILRQRALFDIAACLFFMVKFEFNSAIAIIKAYRDYWSMRKSRETTANKDFPKKGKVDFFQKSIVIQYYLRKKKTFSQV